MSGVENDHESSINAIVALLRPPTDKRARSGKRPISVSPTKCDENVHCLPGGCCPKCKEVETDSKAIYTMRPTYVLHGFMLHVRDYLMRCMIA